MTRQSVYQIRERRCYRFLSEIVENWDAMFPDANTSRAYKIMRYASKDMAHEKSYREHLTNMPNVTPMSCLVLSGMHPSHDENGMLRTSFGDISGASIPLQSLRGMRSLLIKSLEVFQGIDFNEERFAHHPLAVNTYNISEPHLGIHLTRSSDITDFQKYDMRFLCLIFRWVHGPSLMLATCFREALNSVGLESLPHGLNLKLQSQIYEVFHQMESVLEINSQASSSEIAQSILRMANEETTPSLEAEFLLAHTL